MDSKFFRLRKIINTLNAGIWEWNLVTDEVEVNERWAELLGYKLDELKPVTQKTFIELCHDDDLAASRESINNCIAGITEYYSCEVRLRHKSGYWVWNLVKGSIIERAQDGEPLVILGICQDISATKSIKESLRVEEQRFRALTRLSKTGAWQWDSENNYLWCSEEYFAMLGRDRPIPDASRRFNLMSTWADLLHPDDRESSEQLFADYLAQTDPGLYENEFRMQHSDGSWVWILSRGSTLRDEHGNPTRYTMGTHINITQFKKIQHEFIDLNTNLELRVHKRTEQLSKALRDLRHTQEELLQSEKLAALGGLVAGVSHELNTPIGNALTVATTLINNSMDFRDRLEKGITKRALQEYMGDSEEGCQIIERNLHRAAELIGSFKQLAVDQTSYQRRTFSLSHLVNEVLIAISPSVRKTSHKITVDIQENIIMDSFPGPLSQVLVNFINNAIKHAFAGMEGGQITIDACFSDQEKVSISVVDNGCGIDLDVQKKVFDPFYTTKLGQGGSGLGLHVSYNLVVQLLGGQIKLLSNPGKGSAFIISLPLVSPFSN